MCFCLSHVSSLLLAISVFLLHEVMSLSCKSCLFHINTWPFLSLPLPSICLWSTFFSPHRQWGTGRLSVLTQAGGVKRGMSFTLPFPAAVSCAQTLEQVASVVRLGPGISDTVGGLSVLVITAIYEWTEREEFIIKRSVGRGQSAVILRGHNLSSSPAVSVFVLFNFVEYIRVNNMPMISTKKISQGHPEVLYPTTKQLGIHYLTIIIRSTINACHGFNSKHIC